MYYRPGLVNLQKRPLMVTYKLINEHSMFYMVWPRGFKTLRCFRSPNDNPFLPRASCHLFVFWTLRGQIFVLVFTCRPKLAKGLFLGRFFFYYIFPMRNKAVSDPGLRNPQAQVCIHSHFYPTRRGMSPP